MDTIIATPTSCEVRAVICFLQAGQSAAAIHRRLCRVYSDVMSNSCVREWYRKFRDGCTDVHDEGGQGQHSIVTDELVQKVDQCVHGKRITISELPEEFPQTLRNTLHQMPQTDWVTISSVHGGYQND
jgi:transposase